MGGAWHKHFLHRSLPGTCSQTAELSPAPGSWAGTLSVNDIEWQLNALEGKEDEAWQMQAGCPRESGDWRAPFL